MSARVKVKKVKNQEFSNLASVYDDLLNNKRDPEILEKKNTLLLIALKEFTQSLITFNNLLLKHNIPIDDSISIFVKNSIELMKTNEALTTVEEKFTAIKESKLYVDIFLICKSLKDVCTDLPMVLKGSMDLINPLYPISNFNLRTIEIEELSKEAIIVIYDGLINIFEKSKKFPEIEFMPDIDVNKLTIHIRSAIDSLQEHIPRCKRAFGIIKKAVQTFQKEYPKYHKDVKQSGNSHGFIFGFIDDIANSDIVCNDPHKAVLKREFNVILRHLIKMGEQSMQANKFGNNANAAKLMKLASQQLLL